MIYNTNITEAKGRKVTTSKQEMKWVSRIRGWNGLVKWEWIYRIAA